MRRYYFHLRNFKGVIAEDEEGSELPSLAVAMDQDHGSTEGTSRGRSAR
jgi:hypothetical protein